jgi:Fe-S-cluster containining protein
MRDEPSFAVLKQALAALWLFELWLRRKVRALGRARHWELSGSCNSCGECCRESSIQVSFVTFRFPLARRLFLFWQRLANGFELVSSEPATRTFVFRCTHFDAQTCRCDIYASRPGMCRDYPRLLLEQGWPELFEKCGYKIRARNAEKMRASIDATSLPEEKKAELRKKLRLE